MLTLVYSAHNLGDKMSKKKRNLKKKRNPRVMFNKNDFRFYAGGVDKPFNREVDENESWTRTPKNNPEKRLLKFLLKSEDPTHPEWEARYLWEVVKFWPACRVFIEDEVDLELTRNKIVDLLLTLQKSLEAEGYFLPDYVFQLREVERNPQLSLWEDTGLSFLTKFKRDQ